MRVPLEQTATEEKDYECNDCVGPRAVRRLCKPMRAIGRGGPFPKILFMQASPFGIPTRIQC